jgi:hypothetical protein
MRIKRNLKSFQESDEALTSIVVTVMLIGIIMGLIIGPILTIQIPNEIEDNEALHMEKVSQSFSDLRSTVNTLISEREIDVNAPNRIPLGTRTNNFLDAGSTGSLSVKPYDSQVTIYDTEDSQSIFAIGKGKVEYRSNSIYFDDQSYIYENNGIIVEQGSRSTVKTGPVFEVYESNATSNLTLSMSVVNLVGYPDTLGGSKSQVIETTLIAAETNEYYWIVPENVTIKIETLYPESWVKYYNNLLFNITKLDSSNVNIVATEGIDDIYSVSINFKQVSFLTVEIAVIDTKLS